MTTPINVYPAFTELTTDPSFTDRD